MGDRKGRSNSPDLDDDGPQQELSDIVSQYGPTEKSLSQSIQSLDRESYKRELFDYYVQRMLDSPKNCYLVETALKILTVDDKGETRDLTSVESNGIALQLLDAKALESCFTDLETQKLLTESYKRAWERLIKDKVEKEAGLVEFSVKNDVNMLFKRVEMLKNRLLKELEETWKPYIAAFEGKLALQGPRKTETLKEPSMITQTLSKQKRRKLSPEPHEDADASCLIQTHDTKERKLSSEVKHLSERQKKISGDQMVEPKNTPAKDEGDFDENNSAEMKELYHINVHKFACVINDNIGTIAAANSQATPYEIVEEAVTQVVLQDVVDDELSYVDICDGRNKRSVTMCCGAKEVCWIADDALKQLLHTSKPFISGAEGFKFYLDDQVNEFQNSTSEAESAGVGGDNSSESENGKLSDVPREKKFQFPYQIPKNRIRFKGVPWVDSGGSDQEQNYGHRDERYSVQSNNVQTTLKKIKGMKKRSAEKWVGRLNRRRSLHITTTNYCSRCGNKADKRKNGES